MNREARSVIKKECNAIENGDSASLFDGYNIPITRLLTSPGRFTKVGDVNGCREGVSEGMADRSRGSPPNGNVRSRLRDVAERSGVSVTTASRVLNGNPTGLPISAETIQRVRQAAIELQYHANAAARALGTHLTETIALIVPVVEEDEHYFHRLSHLKMSEVLSGIYSVTRHHQYRLVIQMADRHFLQTRAYLGLAHSVAVDGLIWWGVPMRPDLLSLNCPVVALNARLDDAVHHSVLVDNRGGARLMVEHLVDLGHQQIAFIAGPDDFFDSRERLAGYQEAMNRFGFEPVIDRGDLFYQGGCAATRRLLQRAPRPTAIFAANDLMAIGAISAARELGIVIPDQLAIVGADGLDQLACFSPGITTVQTWMHRAATMATEHLLRLINGEVIGTIAETLPVTLMIRETCGYRARYGTRVEGRRPGALVPPLGACDQPSGPATFGSERSSPVDFLAETRGS